MKKWVGFAVMVLGVLMLATKVEYGGWVLFVGILGVL